MATIIGDLISGSTFAPHPIYGARRDVLVTEVSGTTGRWITGTITCRDCGADREIHSGDHFQVTQCSTCKDQDRKAAGKAKRANNPAAQANKDERAAKKADRDATRAQQKAVKAAQRAQEAADKAVAAAEAKKALIAKVAGEHGVAVAS